MLADPIFLAGTLFLLLWITPIIASHAPSPVVSRFPDFVQYQYVLHIVRIHSFSHVTIDCAPYRIIFVCVFVFVYMDKGTCHCHSSYWFRTNQLWFWWSFGRGWSVGISCFASSIGQGEPRWARPACQDIGGVMLLPQGILKIFINNSLKLCCFPTILCFSHCSVQRESERDPPPKSYSSILFTFPLLFLLSPHYLSLSWREKNDMAIL